MIDYEEQLKKIESLLASKEAELIKALEGNAQMQKELKILKQRKVKVEVEENADYYYDWVWTTVKVKDYDGTIIFEETYKVT